MQIFKAILFSSHIHYKNKQISAAGWVLPVTQCLTYRYNILLFSKPYRDDTHTHTHMCTHTHIHHTHRETHTHTHSDLTIILLNRLNMYMRGLHLIAVHVCMHIYRI